MNRKRVIALGFFDGVHLGHGALLRAVRKQADALGEQASVMSFDRHPASLIAGTAIPQINTVDDRIRLIRHYYGIDEVILAHFDEKMMHQPWRAFITEYLAKELNAGWVIAGEDFHFGDCGAGNAMRLREKCGELGIGCDIVGMVAVDGTQVHSTAIRQLIADGEMEQANRLLGHPHILTQTVTTGKGLGRILGFPTVNLPFPADVVQPALGVYATKLRIDGKELIAVTNVGVRPTVEQGGAVNVESFILDFDGDLYGKEIQVEFYRHLRGERKFETVQALTEEVMRNAQQTRDYFAQR